MEENENTVVINIRPLTKIQRILLALADYFIHFALCFILLNVLVFPICKAVGNGSEIYNSIQEDYGKINDAFVNQKLLFVDPNNVTNDFNDYVEYTYKAYLSYYTFDDTDHDISNPQFSNNLENEVIYHYFHDIIHDDQTYINKFQEYNNEDNYFVFDGTSFSLKEEYKVILKAELLEVSNDEYTTTFNNIKDHVFAKLFYVDVMGNIENRDLVYGENSYNSLLNDIKNYNDSLKNIALFSILISFGLSSFLYYGLYPLIDKNHKTTAMLFLRREKLNFKTLSFTYKKEALVSYAFHVLLNMSCMLVVPMSLFGVSYTFNLPVIFVLSSISLLSAIVSLFIIIFNEYNRSLIDLLSFSVIITEKELDEIFKHKGYIK